MSAPTSDFCWVVFVLSSLECRWLTLTSEYNDRVPASSSGLLIPAFSILEDTMLTLGEIKFTGVYVSRQVKRFFIHFLIVPILARRFP